MLWWTGVVSLLVLSSSVALASNKCWFSDLAGPVLVDAAGAEHESCLVASSSRLVALLFASGLCDSCVSFRSHLTSLPTDQGLRLVLLSRDPNQVRFERHLRALGDSTLALPFRKTDSERLNVEFQRPSLPTLVLFSSLDGGRIVDSHGYHTILHLGIEGAMRYWEERSANRSAAEVNHRDLFLAAHPPSPNLLAKLQPAKTDKEL